MKQKSIPEIWEKISGYHFDTFNTVENISSISLMPQKKTTILSGLCFVHGLYLYENNNICPDCGSNAGGKREGNKVIFEYVSPFEFKVNANGYEDLLQAIDNHLNVYAPNYYFHPKYQSGVWDGKIRFWNRFNGKLSIGLFLEIAKFIKEQGYIISIDDELTKLLKPSDIEFNIDLPGYEYQEKYEFQNKAVQKLLNNRRGIAVIATGGGKGGMIIKACKGVRENLSNEKILIIVPTVQLVEQQWKEFKIAGWPKNNSNIGRHYGAIKELDKSIIISTWQSLASLNRKKKLTTFLKDFGIVIVDEVHTAKAKELKNILEKMKNTIIRFGFTATMPPERCDLLSVKSSIGDLVWVEGAKKLQQKGVLSEINIKIINLIWPNSKIKRTFQQERKWLEEIEFRNIFIQKIVELETNKGHNVLILVEKIKHGKELTEKINGAIFIHGGVEIEERESVREAVDENEGGVIVATYGTFQLGINMKKLHCIVFAMPGKSSIRTIQSIGRGLRKHKEKEQLTLFDIADNFKYTTRHSLDRRKIYYGEKWYFKTFDVKISQSMI